MAFGDWFATRRVRHGATAGVVVLATGGLLLLHADAAPEAYTVLAPHPMAVSPRFATPPALATPGLSLPPTGPDTVSFVGPHVHGTLALSNSRTLAGARAPFYADLTVSADGSLTERAPLAMVIVLDTSGSMEGEKLREAKSAVKELVRKMRDEDNIAFVRYSDRAEVVEPLRRVGDVRGELAARIDRLSADGGTAIPLGLETGIDALNQGLARAEPGDQARVRRVVLVSDGLDSSRPRSERLARASAWNGVTVSSMGIGLDFDEAYMGGLALAGHGNFGFVNDGPTLSAFLQRELVETATTVAQATTAHLHLPDGVRFVRSTGADVEVNGREVDLRFGSIYADEAKRVLLQLSTDLPAGAIASLTGSLTWTGAGGIATDAVIPQLQVVATSDTADVDRSRNPTVYARVASVEASERQVEAAAAYGSGDGARAATLIQRNIAALKSASVAAPGPVASALARQASSYADAIQEFKAAPASMSGKAAAKRVAADNLANSAKSAF